MLMREQWREQEEEMVPGGRHGAGGVLDHRGRHGMEGPMIRAFYIIIFTSYIIILECYWHCYIIFLHFLDDLWDFYTKSLFLVFNFSEAENLLFLVLMFQELQGPKWKKENCTVGFSSGER